MPIKFSKQAVARILAAGGIVGAIAAAAWVVANRRLFLVNEVTTGDSQQYPELRAHVYYATPAQALEQAETGIRSLNRWRHILTDRDGLAVYGEAESLLGLISDIGVNLTPLGPRHTRAIIQSRSRLGGGDLGENARNVRALQAAMDDRMVGG